MTDFKAIAAVSENGVIGHKGQIPWHVPEDLKWFRDQTRGHVIVVGRHTFMSFKQPLPGRHTVVLSQTLEAIPGVEVVKSPQSIIDYKSEKTVWICGGAGVYEAFMPLCDELFITHIHKKIPGDVYFPNYLHLFERASVLREEEDFHIVRYKRHAAS